MKWYVVNVYASGEQRVADAIKAQAEKKGLSEFFGEILVPSEEVVEVKKGQKITTERKFFPGYILVEMELNEDTWHLVRSIPRVSMFLGTKGKPVPVRQAEVDKVKASLNSSSETIKYSVTYEIGDTVKVCDGPFASFNGVVEEVDELKSRLKVAVSIFGRPTNVDLGFEQVEKA